jgi:hypothetical protein
VGLTAQNTAPAAEVPFEVDRLIYRATTLQPKGDDMSKVAMAINNNMRTYRMQLHEELL